MFKIFRSIVRRGDTYAIADDISSDDAKNLWVNRAPGATVVAERGDDIFGTAKFGPIRSASGAHIANASYMVAPGWQGRGVGRTLCEYSLQWARDHDYRGVQFNAVVETNEHAVRLYESLGFTIIGTVPGAFHHPTRGYVGLHVMYLDLTQ